MRVSLLIPCYNCEEYIVETVTQARNQTKKFAEIICYDDASSDNTIKILEKLNVKILKDTKNRGAAFARNRLLEVASCEFVHFHDADDSFLRNDFLEILESQFDDYDIVFGKTIFIELDGKKSLYPDVKFDSNFKIEYFMDRVVHLNSVIFKKKSLLQMGGFREQFRTHEDILLFILAAYRDFRFRFVDECVALHRKNEKSTMNSIDSRKHHLGSIKICGAAILENSRVDVSPIIRKLMYHARELAVLGYAKEAIFELQNQSEMKNAGHLGVGGNIEKILMRLFGVGAGLRYLQWRAVGRWR